VCNTKCNTTKKSMVKWGSNPKNKKWGIHFIWKGMNHIICLMYERIYTNLHLKDNSWMTYTKVWIFRLNHQQQFDKKKIIFSKCFKFSTLFKLYILSLFWNKLYILIINIFLIIYYKKLLKNWYYKKLILHLPLYISKHSLGREYIFFLTNWKGVCWKLKKLRMFHFTVKTKKYLTLPVKSFIYTTRCQKDSSTRKLHRRQRKKQCVFPSTP
jgi:hypothetical protein